MGIDLGTNGVGRLPTETEAMMIREKLGINTQILTIGELVNQTHILTISDVNKYLRFLSSGQKTIIVPMVGDDFSPSVGSIFTIRNANIGDLTISPINVSVTINYSSQSNIIQPNTTAQLLYVNSNEWDLL